MTWGVNPEVNFLMKGIAAYPSPLLTLLQRGNMLAEFFQADDAMCQAEVWIKKHKTEIELKDIKISGEGSCIIILYKPIGRFDLTDHS